MDFENMRNIVIQAVVLTQGESSSDEEDDDGGGLPPIDIEAWKRLGDPTFKQQFRMNRCLFERLVVAVGRKMVSLLEDVAWRRGMAINTALMMSLWTMATRVTFGVARGSVHNQYKTIIQVLHNMADESVRWPSRIEQEHIAREFEDMYTYPGVLGCIDGSFIPIFKPREEPQRYVNRHHQYSLILQAVSDNRLVFRDVYFGEAGAVGDARTFQRSALCNLMMRRHDCMYDKHLLGDGAYQLTSKLMSPYRDNGNMTRRQRTHNYYLSRCRSCIERAFAFLKGKWRRLKKFPSNNLVYSNDTVMACVVLPNFIILEGEEYEEVNEADFDMVPAHRTGVNHLRKFLINDDFSS